MFMLMLMNITISMSVVGVNMGIVMVHGVRHRGVALVYRGRFVCITRLLTGRQRQGQGQGQGNDSGKCEMPIHSNLLMR